jgi:hypothetical protein
MKQKQAFRRVPGPTGTQRTQLLFLIPPNPINIPQETVDEDTSNRRQQLQPDRLALLQLSSALPFSVAVKRVIARDVSIAVHSCVKIKLSGRVKCRCNLVVLNNASGFQYHI